MKDSYKYFQPGDKVISIKRRKHPFRMRELLGDRPELFKVYVFRGYVTDSKQRPDFGLMVVEGDGLYYDGHEFISQIEYRGIQLKKIKRNLFFKKLLLLNKIRIFVNDKVKLKN